VNSGVYREARMKQAGKKALSTGGDVNESLKWEVFVTPGIPTAGSDLPPGTKQLMWSPISSTLISGKRDAVLVDTFITVEQADRLVERTRKPAVSGSLRSTKSSHSTHAL
jgi:hypothetical protein